MIVVSESNRLPPLRDADGSDTSLVRHARGFLAEEQPIRQPFLSQISAESVKAAYHPINAGLDRFSL